MYVFFLLFFYIRMISWNLIFFCVTGRVLFSHFDFITFIELTDLPSKSNLDKMFNGLRMVDGLRGIRWFVNRTLREHTKKKCTCMTIKLNINSPRNQFYGDFVAGSSAEILEEKKFYQRHISPFHFICSTSLVTFRLQSSVSLHAKEILVFKRVFAICVLP